MKKYLIIIWKYDFIEDDTTIQKIEVKTNDIYHEIGKIYCKSLEKIENIRYYEI